jgi:hypothetical protein
MVSGARAGPARNAAAEGRTIGLVDEVDEPGFLVLSLVARPDTPGGPTPVLRAPLSHDHWSAIRVVPSAAGRRFTHVPAEACRGPAGVACPRHLRRQVRGTLRVLWDGAPVYRCQPVPVEGCLARGGAKRLDLKR